MTDLLMVRLLYGWSLNCWTVSCIVGILLVSLLYMVGRLLVVVSCIIGLVHGLWLVSLPYGCVVSCVAGASLIV